MSRFNNSIIKSCKISSCQKFMSKNALIFDILDRFPRYNFLETFKKNRYARNLNISKFYNFSNEILRKIYKSWNSEMKLF